MAEEKRVRTYTTSILVILLVIVAFLVVSMFWTRIRSLEQGKVPEKTAQASPSPGTPQQPGAILGKEDINKIESGGAAVKGKDDTPITIVEFSEYLCPYCAEYVGFDSVPSKPIDEEKTYQQIIKDYVDTGKVRYIFRDFPVHGEKAKAIAEAAYCAGEQDEYWQYHDLLFERQRELYETEDLRSLLETLALGMNLDVEGFSSCLADNEFGKVIDDNYQLGQSVGVGGTPTFFINGQKITGAQPFANFKRIIDAELAK